MSKSLVTAALVGAIIVTAGGAAAGYKVLAASHSAEVIGVKALTKSVKTPRQECHDEQVTRTRPVKDQDRTAPEQRCETVYDTREEPSGYEVEYVLNGKQHRIHMDHDPGKQIPVKDGRIVVESGEQAADRTSQSS